MISGLGFPMALQFKPEGKGYVYRKDQVGPAFEATMAERNSYIRWYGWIVVTGFVLYFASMIGMSVLAGHYITSDSNAVGAAGAIVMAATTSGSLYLYLRWMSHAPARAFCDRPQVAPAKSRKQIFGKRLARITYTKIVTVSGSLAVALVFGTLDEPDAIWLAIGLPAVVAAGFTFWKWRIESEADGIIAKISPRPSQLRNAEPPRDR